jgi:signal transduction histidine kinase
MVTLHVTDEGGGFSPDYIDSAFERFSRADVARGRGGAGLGLAIVAAIAAAHHGTVGAENLTGGGADVWIAVPVQGRVA